MSTVHLVPADICERYHVKEWRNAAGILSTSCPSEWEDIQDVLRRFRLLKSEIMVGGGNRSLISKRIDTAFYAKGWVEKGFATSITVDERKIDSPTHAVDCLKSGVAVEMEWNNKDPFFDRDLNNFRLLFEPRAIQVGIIITRSWELQEIFKRLGFVWKGHDASLEIVAKGGGWRRWRMPCLNFCHPPRQFRGRRPSSI
jgi:Restriction endonuclease BglII